MNQPRRSWLTILGLLASVVIAGMVGGCGKHQETWEPNKLHIMVSFPPLYCFTANVVKGDAQVRTLLDATGIHDYEPKPHDAIALHDANLFLINGLGLDEDFARLLANSSNNQDPNFKVIEVGEDERLKPLLRKMAAHDQHEEKDGKEHKHTHAHKHGEYDPHIWLGLPEAIVMVQVIRDKLSEADKAHAEQYKANAEAYTKTLQKLIDDGNAAFKNKKNKKLISFHDSLGYFARTFGLNIVKTIQPVAGEEDTSGARLRQLVDLCIKENIKVIAVEPNQIGNSSAKALLDELKAKKVEGVQLVEVDILESVPRADLIPKYYEDKMRENIKKLSEAMQ
jgi:ABC-type Zn uptake system ZnuABC Zn-binding protein ZnuA